ncbi:flagellar basal body-associated FliL family protein [Halovulum sp. GXIMD14793]
MTDQQPDPEAEDAPAPKGGAKGIVIALIGALVAGGGGFFATYSGILDSLLGGGHDTAHMAEDANVAFVPLEPLVVSLGPRANARLLKFTAELEVAPEHVGTVTAMMPRIQDVLNTFLRAVEEDELEKPGSLTLLRAQMLRRIQIVLGEDHVRDLLIVEFILS